MKKVQIQNSDPLLIQIRDLLSFEDVLHTEKTLAYVFNQPEEKIKKALGTLEKLGWIKQYDNTWKATEQSVKIEDNHGNSLLHEFHKSSLQEALKHIKTEELHRKFRSLHLTLSEEEFKDFHQKISNYLTLLFNEYSQANISQGKKLYQINYNISPRTLTIES